MSDEKWKSWSVSCFGEKLFLRANFVLTTGQMFKVHRGECYREKIEYFYMGHIRSQQTHLELVKFCGKPQFMRQSFTVERCFASIFKHQAWTQTHSPTLSVTFSPVIVAYVKWIICDSEAKQCKYNSFALRTQMQICATHAGGNEGNPCRRYVRHIALNFVDVDSLKLASIWEFFLIYGKWSHSPRIFTDATDAGNITTHERQQNWIE